MTLTKIGYILKSIIDIAIVWIMFYYIFKNIRNNVKLSLLFKGVAIIIILKIVSDAWNLTTIGLILEYILMWGPLAIIIIFQPEIRSILEQIGRTQLLGRHKVLSVDEREKLVYEIIKAVDHMKKDKIGALIVIERDISLNEYIEKAKKIYADVSSDLIESIFFPNNPLHDGGIIMQGNKITCAGAVFPTSNNLKTKKNLGTRHRAALGIAEETDCISLIVSEETGKISIAVKGDIYYNLTLDEVRMMLLDELKPIQNSEYANEIEEEEIYEEEK